MPLRSAAPLLLLVLLACGSEERTAAVPKPASPVASERKPVPVVVETPEPAAPVPPAEPTSPPEPKPEPEPEPEPEPAGGSGRFVARVVYAGALPLDLPPLRIDAAAAVGCDEHFGAVDTTDRSIVVSDSGEVAFAVVSLEGGGLEVDGAGASVHVDQRGCRFEPHVVVAPVGASLRFANSDSVNHNVHAYAKKTTIPNANVAPGGESSVALVGDEVFRVGCDIHPWMASWVFVAETPFAAVSDAAGRVVFEDVPAGEYKLKVWHEKLEKAGGGGGRRRGGSSQTVAIRDGETTEVVIELEP